MKYKLKPGKFIRIFSNHEGVGPKLRSRLNAGETVELTIEQASGIKEKVAEVKESK